MKVNRKPSALQLARVVRQCLEEGLSVEIDGLGIFEPGSDNKFHFHPLQRPQVFIAYVEEDVTHALRLYEDLERSGHNPWLDRMKLLPGQNWARAIENAIEVSGFFIPCFSRRALCKRGMFFSELRYALDCATSLPLDDSFVIPVRLEDCIVPARIMKQIQYVDLFPAWEGGVRRVIEAIDRQQRLRQRRRLRLAG